MPRTRGLVPSFCRWCKHVEQIRECQVGIGRHHDSALSNHVARAERVNGQSICISYHRHGAELHAVAVLVDDANAETC